MTRNPVPSLRSAVRHLSEIEKGLSTLEREAGAARNDLLHVALDLSGARDYKQLQKWLDERDVASDEVELEAEDEGEELPD